MNLMFLLSPLMLSLLAIVAIFAFVLFVLDIRRTSHQNHLRRLMRSFVNEHAAKTFSIVVHADTSVESVTPLLDSLEQQNYSKLQVIIIAGNGGDTKFMNDLRRIQRQKKNILPLRVIRQGTRTEKSLIRRYANSDGLLWLSPSDRLSKDFFRRMSIELLDESCQAISPQLALRTDDTLGTASRALNLVAKQTINTLTGRRVAEPRIVRRSAYLRGDPIRSTGVEHSTVLVKNMLSEYSTNIFIEASLLAATLLVAGISAVMLPYGWQFVVYAFVGVIVLLVLLRLLTYPYSAWTKVTLGLLIPLWPLTALMATLTKSSLHKLNTIFRKVREATLTSDA
jgi:hypothetical protein